MIEEVIFGLLAIILVIFTVCCLVGMEMLPRRYKKFYETTEEGRKLYCALYAKDRLGSRCDWLVNRMSELRDKIDVLETYFPEESREKASVHGMKTQYKEYSDELYRTKEMIKDWSERIDKIVAALPKKYRGILEYNWEDAKVEIEEVSVE